MTVGFKVGSIIDEVGAQDFLHAFFSTISYHLEPQGWGSRFPEFMNQLYQGSLESKLANKVLTDLVTIQHELKDRRPDQVVWDIEDLSVQPPWGSKISTHIKDLSNYFVTSTGRDLFEVIIECLEAAHRERCDITIEHY